MALLFFKSIHVVGFVAWFAGLFYLVRMFVYHVEAEQRPEGERDAFKKQFNLMEWRVYKIICNPAMMITWTAGIIVIALYGWEWFTLAGWLHVKLVLLVLLTVYQLWMKRIIVQLENDNLQYSSFQFRLLNEVPTVLLLSITLLAIYQNTLNFLYAFGGVLVFGVLLYFGAKAYKRHRRRLELKQDESGE